MWFGKRPDRGDVRLNLLSEFNAPTQLSPGTIVEILRPIGGKPLYVLIELAELKELLLPATGASGACRPLRWREGESLLVGDAAVEDDGYERCFATLADSKASASSCAIGAAAVRASQGSCRGASTAPSAAARAGQTSSAPEGLPTASSSPESPIALM
jgi:hypothetical protein